MSQKPSGIRDIVPNTEFCAQGGTGGTYETSNRRLPHPRHANYDGRLLTPKWSQIETSGSFPIDIQNFFSPDEQQPTL